MFSYRVSTSETLDFRTGSSKLSRLFKPLMKPQQRKVQEPIPEEGNGGVATAVAVHELNNLLTLILGYSHLIVDGTKRTDPNRHNAEQILRAGERAAVLPRAALQGVRLRTRSR